VSLVIERPVNVNALHPQALDMFDHLDVSRRIQVAFVSVQFVASYFSKMGCIDSDFDIPLQMVEAFIQHLFAVRRRPSPVSVIENRHHNMPIFCVQTQDCDHMSRVGRIKSPRKKDSQASRILHWDRSDQFGILHKTFFEEHPPAGICQPGYQLSRVDPAISGARIFTPSNSISTRFAK